MWYGRGMLVHLRRGKLVHRTKLPCKGYTNLAAFSKTFKPKRSKTNVCNIVHVRPRERAHLCA